MNGSIPTERIVCPFPPCGAAWVQAAGLRNVPRHKPHGAAGRAGWLAWCPGSLMLYRADGTLITPDREKLARAVEAWDTAVAALRARNRKSPLDDTPPAMIPEGRPADPLADNVIYFPGRPADAPEPGPGDPPAAAIPPDVGGIPLTGRDANMSDRHALKALALVAANQLQQLGGVLDRMIGEVTAAQGLAVAAEHQVHSATALVIRCVGTGEGAPEPGQMMAEYTALATDILTGPQGSVPASLALALTRLETARTQVRLAEHNARMYAAIP